MKDFLQQQLEIGDRVVLVAPNYRHLCEGVIIGFTAKFCKIEYSNYWNFGTPYTQTIKQSPDQLIKINKNEEI